MPAADRPPSGYNPGVETQSTSKYTEDQRLALECDVSFDLSADDDPDWTLIQKLLDRFSEMVFPGTSRTPHETAVDRISQSKAKASERESTVGPW